MFEGQPKGFPFGDFRVEDVMLPEGDDMGIPSDDDDIDEDTIEQETGFETVVGTLIVRCRLAMRTQPRAPQWWTGCLWSVLTKWKSSPQCFASSSTTKSWAKFVKVLVMHHMR